MSSKKISSVDRSLFQLLGYGKILRDIVRSYFAVPVMIGMVQRYMKEGAFDLGDVADAGIVGTLEPAHRYRSLTRDAGLLI